MHQRWPLNNKQVFPDLRSAHNLSDDDDDGDDEEEDIDHIYEEDVDDEEDEGNDNGNGSSHRQLYASVLTLESNILNGYGGTTLHNKDVFSEGNSPSSEPALSKIRDLLVASKLKAMSCLICLEKVRNIDPIWHCTMGCHAIYHLICIQAWANEACKSMIERARSRLSQESFPNVQLEITWHCPKCRITYSQVEVPRESLCYCGKVIDPPVDPWLTPHSCGKICGRTLSLDGQLSSDDRTSSDGRILSKGCGHHCKLLCHPGKCPPCPQFVKTSCHCKKMTDVRRCGHKHFSCGERCGNDLACGIHVCEEVCHAEDCPPCKKSGSHKCRCGRIENVRACSESDFSCEQSCDKPLPCKKHWCKKVCHSGSCGDCELQGRQRCPCGKLSYKDMPCDAVAPTCGSTCEKLLSCSLHRCQERCHVGDCKAICRVMTLKICRCGSLRKEVPCHQDLQCERKCQRWRDCKRHPCKRRCCNGDCPPCSEICGRRLRCGNHKCPALCHRGLCAPCPVSVRISCACGSTAYEVPCGTEKDKKPPRCSKRCNVLPRCRHGMNCKPHRCHYGACPPCDLVCGERFSCGHTCKERCHGPRPPPNPVYTLRQRKKHRKPDEDKESMGIPCPPCNERILKQCLGGHMGGERIMACSQSIDYSCASLCGNLLACGNHTCQKSCHNVTVPRTANSQLQPSIDSEDLHDTCDQCKLTCQKKRMPPCPHPCIQSCHFGVCDPCKAPLKRLCYCGTLVRSFDCSFFNSLTEEERDKQRSCGGPCHRKLPNCMHLCSDICHPGPCKMAENCRKKVTVRCACLRLKKDWMCSDVQAALINSKPRGLKVQVGVGLLACDDDCLRLAEEHRSKEEMEELRQRKAPVSKELPTKKMPKRRKQYGQDVQVQQSRFKEISWQLVKWCLIIMSILLALTGIYFGARGLQSLSDWMNERDAKRPRTRPGKSFL